MTVTLRRSARNIRKTSRVPRSVFLIFLAHFFQKTYAGRGAQLSQPPKNSHPALEIIPEEAGEDKTEAQV
jgi:hypothetical protein